MNKHDQQVQALARAMATMRHVVDMLVTVGDQLRQVEVLPAGVNAAQDVLRKTLDAARDLNTRVGNLLHEVTR